MDPTGEPRFPAPEPTAPRDIRSDDAVVAYLRSRAPGLPPMAFDGRAVTVRARGALRRLRRRRLWRSAVAVAAAGTAYLVLALAGPVVPGLGSVNVPGGESVRAMVGGLLPGVPPGPHRWPGDVDRLEREVLPVVQRLQVRFYLSEPGCRVFEYSRGDFRDGDADCQDLVPFDDQARADFGAVTEAVERSGVAVERIGRDRDGLRVRLPDYTWQYNYEYVYRPDATEPPPLSFPGEQWTHVRDGWWFHRAHDD